MCIRSFNCFNGKRNAHQRSSTWRMATACRASSASTPTRALSSSTVRDGPPHGLRALAERRRRARLRALACPRVARAHVHRERAPPVRSVAGRPRRAWLAGERGPNKKQQHQQQQHKQRLLSSNVPHSRTRAQSERQRAEAELQRKQQQQRVQSKLVASKQALALHEPVRAGGGGRHSR